MAVSEPEPAPWLTVGQGSVSYSQALAEAVLAEYAFGTTALVWKPKVISPADPLLTARPRAATRFRWAYRTYDCLPNSPDAFCVTDLLAVSALDARAGAAEYLAMEAILPELSEVLGNVDVTQTFWDLPRKELGANPPEQRTPSWWLWRAWMLLMGLDDVGVAITYKTLHRKRPWFFPIFDSNTVAQMGGNLAWQVLHDELISQADKFVYLEQWFKEEAAKRGGVCLSRLRIHDILLWSGSGARGALASPR